MKKIIADTNFLMSQFEYGIDLRSELCRIVHGPMSLLVSSGTMGELRMMAGKTGRKSSAARFVLQNLPSIGKRIPVEIVESRGPVDEWIIKHALANRFCVATNDVPLRKRLLAAGVQVIAAKGKSKLDFV